MDKVEHGNQLAAAMARRQYSRTNIADMVGRDVRTITNWTRGKTMPSLAEREKLRQWLGPYDVEGDPVEVAVKSSELDEWRQDAVLSFYKKNLQEQRAGAAG